MRQRLGGRRRCVFPETGEPSGWRDRAKRGEKRPRGFRVGEGRKGGRRARGAASPARCAASSPGRPCPPLLRRSASRRRLGSSSPLSERKVSRSREDALKEPRL